LFLELHQSFPACNRLLTVAQAIGAELRKVAVFPEGKALRRAGRRFPLRPMPPLSPTRRETGKVRKFEDSAPSA